MIPSMVSARLEKALQGYLKFSFNLTNPFFNGMLDRFFARRPEMFKGPFIDINLPFVGSKNAGDFFPEIPLGFSPHLHQELAWQRLTGEKPQSTIVATGTGSGKTECFLLPILEYCRQQNKLGVPGIKAIIIYPMNALANDQSARLAELVAKSEALRNAGIRAGLYVGQKEEEPSKIMQADKLITDRDVLRKAPPDILLTNYKMLDYMLVRPKDFDLWSQNEPDTLRYVVVDELHSFDGAQGSDLACLLRRLKARLNMNESSLCAVGTSATVGDNNTDLLEFARHIFAENFSTDAIIREQRIKAAEWLKDYEAENFDIDLHENLVRIKPSDFHVREDFFCAWTESLYDRRVSTEELDTNDFRCWLGDKILHDRTFHNILKIMDGQTRDFNYLLQRLMACTPLLQGLDADLCQEWLCGFLALVSHAENPRKDYSRFSLVEVRLQLWLREMRRMVCLLDEEGSDGLPQKAEARLCFGDDLKPEKTQLALPVVHCQECGYSGFGAYLKRADDKTAQTELKDFYSRWFSRSHNIRVLFPVEAGGDFVKTAAQKTEESNKTNENTDIYRLCTRCGHFDYNFSEKNCRDCGHNGFLRVIIPNMSTKNQDKEYFKPDCPRCQSEGSLSILGARSATLSSVLIDQLFATPFNSDKKLLAFSDSVQDAAHRAGFFQFRTWNHVFRITLQGSLNEHEEDISLLQACRTIPQKWAKEMESERFVSFFMPTDLHWFRDYMNMLNGHGVSEQLRQDLINRLQWQIISEYGFKSHIGRSLSSTGCSTVCPDRVKLDSAVERISATLHDSFPMLGEIDNNAIRGFLLGLLYHTGQMGAYWLDVFHGYLNVEGKIFYWYKSKPKWMQDFGSNRRKPRFLTDRQNNDSNSTLLTIYDTKKKETWFELWTKKSLIKKATFTDFQPGLWEEVLKILVENEIMILHNLKSYRVWSLNPKAFVISSKTAKFCCSTCGHRITVTESEMENWQGLPCLLRGCHGEYEKDSSVFNWYQEFYKTALPEQVFVKEHTGLLQRDEREKLEKSFKAPPEERSSFFPNVLSCTPTLEMGIDIGDLSSLILCTIPPQESSYRQRIGRAGRRNGNAVCVAVAEGRSHDQYFYQQPELMYAGDIKTPGLFLGASSVLKRQLFAFALDSWIQVNEGAVEVPDEMGVILKRLEDKEKKSDSEQKNREINGFPFNFTSWVDQQKGPELLQKFFGLFKEDELSPEICERLRIYMQGDAESPSLGRRLIDCLSEDVHKREEWRQQTKKIKDKIKKLQNLPEDEQTMEDIESLKREQAAIKRLIKHIADINIWQHLCNLGLLPNYAFPEAGITLKSLIIMDKGRQEDSEGREYETADFSYERGASAAIREFAPGNWFYAGGRRVRIDQVELNKESIAEWRFCPDCPHCQPESSNANNSACPKCGSIGFADLGQKKSLLRLESVRATNSDRRSRISDDKDDRQIENYIQKMLVEVKEVDNSRVWEIPSAEMPFGFDFVRRACFRDINFGNFSEYGEKVKIALDDRCKNGFNICRECGKVQFESRGNAEANKENHSKICRNAKGDKDSIVPCLWLYREFESEAVRFLLPLLQEVPEEKCVQSFLAAMQLGLRIFYRGQIQHIRAIQQKEPDNSGSGYRNYIILYDTVPGGTGYLQKLFEETENAQPALLDIISRTLEHLRECACNNDPDKDGCYRCVFTYETAFKMSEVSRDVARKILASILENKDNLRRIENVEQININAQEDSELERMFLQKLSTFALSLNNGQPLRKSTYGGLPAYYLKINENLTWVIRQQINIGNKEGVSYPSRPDFLFEPFFCREPQIKPMAVFTDGWQYHRQKFSEDCLKRSSLLQSDAYNVFNIAYYDVKNQNCGGLDSWFECLPNLGIGGAEQLKRFQHLCAQAFKISPEEFGLTNWSKLNEMNSMELFFNWLVNPSAKWDLLGRALILTLLSRQEESINRNLSQYEKILGSWQNFLGEGLSGSGWSCCSQSGRLALFQSWDKANLTSFSRGGLPDYCLPNILLLLDDMVEKSLPEELQKDLQKAWYGWLRLYNILQFCPGTMWRNCNMSGSDDEKLYFLGRQEDKPDSQTEITAQWQEILENCLPEHRELFHALVERGVSLPEGNQEIKDGLSVVTEVECFWPEYRLALITENNAVKAEVAERLNINFVIIRPGPDFIDEIADLTGGK